MHGRYAESLKCGGENQRLLRRCSRCRMIAETRSSSYPRDLVDLCMGKSPCPIECHGHRVDSATIRHSPPRPLNCLRESFLRSSLVPMTYLFRLAYRLYIHRYIISTFKKIRRKVILRKCRQIPTSDGCHAAQAKRSAERGDKWGIWRGGGVF